MTSNNSFDPIADQDNAPQAYLVNDADGNFVAATTAQSAPTTTEGWKALTDAVLAAAIKAAPHLNLDGLYTWVTSSDAEVRLTLTRISQGAIADALPGLELSQDTLGLLAVISDLQTGYRAFILALPAMVEQDGSLSNARSIGSLLDSNGNVYPGTNTEGQLGLTVRTLGAFLHNALENSIFD